MQAVKHQDELAKEQVSELTGDEEPVIRIVDNMSPTKTTTVADRNHQDDDDDDDSDQDEDSTSPTVLKILTEHHDSILQTVSLIKKESAKFNIDVEPDAAGGSKSSSASSSSFMLQADYKDRSSSENKSQKKADDMIKQQPSTASILDGPSGGVGAAAKHVVQSNELEGLNCFLADAKVQNLIKSVAGNETTTFIDKTLNAVNSSKSIQEKRSVLTDGIKQLHSDLKGKKDTIAKDPLFSLALGFAGLNRKSIQFD